MSMMNCDERRESQNNLNHLQAMAVVGYPVNLYNHEAQWRTTDNSGHAYYYNTATSSNNQVQPPHVYIKVHEDRIVNNNNAGGNYNQVQPQVHIKISEDRVVNNDNSNGQNGVVSDNNNQNSRSRIVDDNNQYNSPRVVANNNQYDSTTIVNDEIRKKLIAELKKGAIKLLLSVLLAVVVSLSMILFLVLEVNHMDKTYETLVSFEVEYLGVNPLTISNDHDDKLMLNATSLNLSLSMKIKKTTTVNSPLLVLVEYQGAILSSTTVQPTAYQPTRNQGLVLDMDLIKQLPQVTVDSIAKDFASHNDLELTVHARGTNWSFDLWYDNSEYDIQVECKGIKVRFPSSLSDLTYTTIGNMINAPIPCKVNLHESGPNYKIVTRT